MPISGWDVGAILVKTILYATTLGAAGGAIFLEVCRASVSGADRLRVQRLIGVLSIAALVASAVRFAVLAASMSGEISGFFDESLVSMLLHGREGDAAGARIIGLVLVGWALRIEGPAASWIAVPGAVLAATSFAWVGHAVGAPAKFLSLLLIAVHLLGVAFWLGALMPLLIVARDPDWTRIAGAATRFGQVAMVVVGLLVSAGTSLLWILLRAAPAQLWMSNYGRMVMVKIAFVICLLMLAAANKWWFTWRLQQRDSHARTGLKRTITAEIMVGVLILLVTATFTTLMGPPVKEAPLLGLGVRGTP